jgi:SAM-dependent methyltransferase
MEDAAMDRRRNTDVIVETVAVAGLRVIDIGCGDGHLTRHLARHGAHVLGVECSPRQLAKANAAKREADEEIVEGVGQALPAADGGYDLAVFFNSLHHIPVELQMAALAEAARVLKSGGMVYVSEPLPEGRFFEAVRPIDDETAVRAAAYGAILAAETVGLRPLRELTYVHTLAMADYESFRERIISANTEREHRFAIQDADMRALFAAKASRAADGTFTFDQPMRVNLLVKN